MSATDLLSFATQGFFILLSVMTILDFFRHRDSSRRDIALMFSSLGIPLLIQLASKTLNIQAKWLSVVSSLALLAQPYLMLRLVAYFRPIQPIIRNFAPFGMTISWVIILLVPTPLPAVASAMISVIIVIYFVAVDGYAMVAFIRGAVSASGVVQQRLRLAAAGSGLLALVLLVAGIAIFLPALKDVLTAITQVVTVFSAGAFYLAFAAPRWLRRAWQMEELRTYLNSSANTISGSQETVAPYLDRLCQVASQAVGGLAAGFVERKPPAQEWQVGSANNASAHLNAALSHIDVLDQLWQKHAPAIIREADNQTWLGRVGAKMMFSVPVSTMARDWGLLLVFLSYQSLFIDDDLELLILLCQYSATTLDNYRLIDDLRIYSDELSRLNNQLTQEVTERKRAENEIGQLNESLKVRASELEAANNELESFSYSVSHDLRAPLRAIDGFSRMLVRDYAEKLGDEGQRRLQVVRDGAQQMGQLIDDLLTFSRLNRQPLNKQIVVPGDLARQILGEMGEEMANRNIKVVIADMPNCEVDPTLFKQVYVNLLANAVKFTSHCKSAHIEVGCDRANGSPVYFVKDNGAGFDMRYYDKLFGVFQRLHRAEDYEGTGVGLATCQRIIRRHGGRIWAEGVLDKGASFYFTLQGNEGAHD
jgi:signal transduction histidine kinase